MSTNNERYKVLKSVFDQGRYFKIVCGAGNEDINEVRRLAMVYTLAGATSIDISANVDVVKCSKEGIAWAKQLAPQLNRAIEFDPFINVSIGLKGDPHVRKALINLDACTLCGDCLPVCPQDTISNDFIIGEERCIGCPECFDVCNYGAVEF